MADRLKNVVKPGQRLVLGLSGGVDSMVLLHVLARLAPRMRFALEALHVNHQLSPNAAAWARFCRRECRALRVPCRVVAVNVARGNSVEAAAREARYRVFAAARADYVVLAHNRDDQAETVLLQLLRGTGVKGLGGMRSVRSFREAARRSASGASPTHRVHAKGTSANLRREPLIIRPLLSVARAEIERYAQRHKLEWVRDESNLETRYTRNWLRHEILPQIAERFPQCRDSLARAAGHLQEAGKLLDDLARIDFAAAGCDGGLRVDVLRELPEERVRNVLRFAMDRQGWPMPDSGRLAEAARQALGARRDGQVAVNLGSCELRRHRHLVHLLPRDGAAGGDACLPWQGERRLELPQGVLTMARSRGAGMSAARLATAPVTVRLRSGGERLQIAENRPRRTLKNLLQEARMPPWQRERLPLIYCGNDLACVPGIGVDFRFQARAGEPAVVASWAALGPDGHRTDERALDPD